MQNPPRSPDVLKLSQQRHFRWGLGRYVGWRSMRTALLPNESAVLAFATVYFARPAANALRRIKVEAFPLACLGFAIIVALMAMQSMHAVVVDKRHGPLITLCAATDDESPRDEAFLIEVPQPMTADQATRLSSQLTQLHQNAQARSSGEANDRVVVVLRFQEKIESAGGTRSGELEDVLKIARKITSPSMQRLRCVAWVDAPVTGSEVLLALACESLVVSPEGSVGNATAGQSLTDETSRLIFASIASKRGLLPDAAVAGLADADLEVAKVRLIDGKTEYFAGEELKQVRESGRVVEEDVLSPLGEPLTLTANQLRDFRAATAIVDSEADVADALGVANLRANEVDLNETTFAVMLKVQGRINSQRVRRWQTNLSATIESGDVNAWLVSIDSPGGDLSQSAALAAVLADPGPSIRRVGGYVAGEARGDAALLAVATRPLLMNPDATLGGSGSAVIAPEEVQRQRELINLIASATRRSPALLRGLLDASEPIYRYSNRQTGRIRYATSAEINEDEGTPNEKDAAKNAEADRLWIRGEEISLEAGISAARAIELGLADGLADSVGAVAVEIGSEVLPPELNDRGMVRWVERLGRNTPLAFGLMMIGFMMLSAEMSAPGIGVPGFISMLCFAFFFWTQFLAGTAEWLELLAFGLGLMCIAIELFIVPGVGVFGIGGLCLTMLGIVLMTQTFVVPRNPYQLEQLTRGVWMALGGLGSLIAGFFVVRMYLPQAATAAGLAMEPPNPEIELSERLADFDYLYGQTGTATTPLRPSGKARFGDDLVAVVSDGEAIESGASLKVIQVQGNRIVVETVET